MLVKRTLVQRIGRLSTTGEGTTPYDVPLNEAEEQYPLAPSVLDARHYRDPAQFEREVAEIFMRTWLPACPSEDIAGPRDFFVWDELGQSVVLARQDDGTVAAFHNVCQHRGARLVEGAGHCKPGRIKCPWHGFAYELDGRVCGVPLRETFDEAELDGLRAPAVRTAEWLGWVWICFDDAAPALEEYLGVIGSSLDRYGLDTYRFTHRETVALDANWKLVVDAFNETWHVPFTHKDTLANVVMWRDAIIRIESPHSWMALPLRGFTERIQSDDHQRKSICHYLAFPHTIFSCFPTHLQMWSAWPVAPQRTVVAAYQMVGAPPEGMDAEKWARQGDRDWADFMGVFDEDVEIINGFAKTMHSIGYRRNIFSTAESRLTAFHEEVNRRVC
jgi:phenylpropionate dioxygenase-like ring-hydroxylating dioxygenase large terminal subunit